MGRGEVGGGGDVIRSGRSKLPSTDDGIPVSLALILSEYIDVVSNGSVL